MYSENFFYCLRNISLLQALIIRRLGFFQREIVNNKNRQKYSLAKRKELKGRGLNAKKFRLMKSGMNVG